MNETIIGIIKEIKPYEQISENTELIESGILDSLSILSLVAQLEEVFEVEISEDAITAKNFVTIPNIVQLIGESKKTESER
ncbi:hypothetical protein Elgi_54890 [Paenibacillus elgii]|uniref:acyl carrier protein n=1 Tax=Paenibacillus elgii TaxID=189691 RepID=UPI002D7AF974|nr:hypothetical protein Elgi_54890 [Paenibacillus elgii]